MNERVKGVLEGVLERFRTANTLPQAIATAMFPVPNIPAARWSMLNRCLLVLAGTTDARGFRQWQEVGRQVKKGSRGIYILGPCKKKVEDEETGEEKEKLIGFMTIPVFRVEDTEGEPLDYEPAKLPPLPVEEVARAWGITVTSAMGGTRLLGVYSPARKAIHLATPEGGVFLHELAHAAHRRVAADYASLPKWKREVVAELSAAVLCELTDVKGNLGNSYQYVERYAKGGRLSPLDACVKLIHDAEAVLTEIITAAKGEAPCMMAVGQ